MRRKEKEIVDFEDIVGIIDKCKFCRIAFSHENQPYVIPTCFGFEPNYLYFHSACEGLKIDILRKNPNVCFQMDCDTELVPSEKACNWGVKFKSIIGYGIAEIITATSRKREILSIIMKKYSDHSHYDFSEAFLLKTCVVEISIKSMTGKKSGKE
jgi:uncharacterized protein